MSKERPGKIRRIVAAFADVINVPEEPQTLLNARGFFMGIKMSEAPDFYSGVPAQMREYDGNRLLIGYNLLSTSVSPSAATGFAQMILDMPSLAPTNFVLAVNDLARRRWEYEEDLLTGKTDQYPFVMPTDEHVFPHVKDLYERRRDLGPIPQSDQTDEIKVRFRRQLEESGVQIEEKNGHLVIVPQNPS